MGRRTLINREGALFQGTFMALHIGGMVTFMVAVFLSAAAATDHAYRWWRAVNK